MFFSDRHVRTYVMPSVLRRCWLGGRKGIRPVNRHIYFARTTQHNQSQTNKHNRKSAREARNSLTGRLCNVWMLEKNYDRYWVVGCWRGYICLGRGADLQLPLPLTISCSSKSRLVLSFWDCCILCSTRSQSHVYSQQLQISMLTTFAQRSLFKLQKNVSVTKTDLHFHPLTVNFEAHLLSNLTNTAGWRWTVFQFSRSGGHLVKSYSPDTPDWLLYLDDCNICEIFMGA